MILLVGVKIALNYKSEDTFFAKKESFTHEGKFLLAILILSVLLFVGANRGCTVEFI
jgi:hypothetical protein